MTAAMLLAIFKAIPTLYKLYEDSVDLYFKQQAASDQNRYAKKKATRDALITALVKPGATADEIKEIRRSLYDLNS